LRAMRLARARRMSVEHHEVIHDLTLARRG
jgi:hypothetical protein